MHSLYKDNVETLQSKIPCFVRAKHIHRATKEDAGLSISIYRIFGRLPSHLGVDMLDIHTLKVKQSLAHYCSNMIFISKI
jgi:hypothetical protein